MVSIITPAYNASRYLSDTIRSVIDQTYRDWEMIIINDCSTDDTADIARSFIREDERIRLIETSENKGAAVARNLGIEIARGDFIAFIDSDDLWHNEKLATQLAVMKRNDVLFSFTSYQVIAKDGRAIKVVKAPREVSYTDLLKGCDIGCSTVIYNAKEIGRHYFQASAPRAREDYVLWLSLSKKSAGDPSMIGIDKSLVSYRKHEGGISSGKSKAALNQWRVYRDIEGLSMVSSIFYFLHYALNGLKKHYL